LEKSCKKKKKIINYIYFSEYFHLLIKHSGTLFQYIAIHTQQTKG